MRPSAGLSAIGLFAVLAMVFLLSAFPRFAIGEVPGVVTSRPPSSFQPEATEDKSTLKKVTTPPGNCNGNTVYDNDLQKCVTVDDETTIVPLPPVPLPPTIEPSVLPNESGDRVLIDTVDGKEPQPPTVPTPPSQEPPPDKIEKEQAPQNQLQSVGESLRQLQQEIRRVDVIVRSAVSEQVDAAMRKASDSVAKGTAEPVRAFDPIDREKRLKELKRAVSEKQNQISEDVRSSISSGDVNSNSLTHLEPVLKSSLSDIELLIKSDTGVSVDLSSGARAVTAVVAENEKGLKDARDELTSQGGLDLYKDTDHDGVSDYDEKHIYQTDPLNAFTAGSLVTDGERILLGFDPHSRGNAQVPVESPQTTGEEVSGIFEIHAINIRLRSLSASATSPIATTSGAVPAFREEVTISGRALPNSFVTLYVFSTPVVVTVKTDLSGAWSYTLNSELPDGEHKLYVATVDAGGKIIAKSPAVPFVKQAEAAAFTPLLITAAPDVDPLDVLQSNFVVVGGALLLVFAVMAFIMLSLKRAPPAPPAAA